MALPSTNAGMIIAARFAFEVLERTDVAGSGQPAQRHRKSRISMMPSQKFGVERPHSAKTFAA